MTEHLAFSGDLTGGWLLVVAVLGLASAALLFVEMRRASRGRLLVVSSGLVALVALLGAVLRPVRVEERQSHSAADVMVLLDASRSIDLPANDATDTRRQRLQVAIEGILERYAGARIKMKTFGADKLARWSGGTKEFDARPQLGSDLSAALEELTAGPGKPPDGLIVVSDGRLDRPAQDDVLARVREALGSLQLPVHTVALTEHVPADASITRVELAQGAVAHQPLVLSVSVACHGGLACDRLPLVARELHLDRPPVKRAEAIIKMRDGRGQAQLEVVLDRAGQRILEFSIEAPEGDRIGDNNRRFVSIEVARERVRLLHIAGRPTYDVRALRTWLKSDASVDVVAFFILRTRTDSVGASQDELALIPFPVDELFSVHLPSFDAVVLQDFEAKPYGLSKYLPALADYVRQGGGLIMVGGPNAFVSGDYAGSALASVMPVRMVGVAPDEAVDLAHFVPSFTDAGRRAPVLQPLRNLTGDTLPQMPGTNIVAGASKGAVVLLEHPNRVGRDGEKMPVLALGEYGSGRTIALTVDGSHKLQFSSFAARTAAGHAHGAFWDALLGWLMRDPRFEPAQVSLPDGCIAGEPTRLAIRSAFAEAGTMMDVVVASMGDAKEVSRRRVPLAAPGETAFVDVGRLAPGGYTATVALAQEQRSTAARRDFACEVGGQEWADPRPDVARLQAIAEATGGRAVLVEGVGSLPLLQSARVMLERRVRALFPAWSWALLAASSLGAHWLLRRRMGWP